jgi:flagellar basal body-associated protein FliL
MATKTKRKKTSKKIWIILAVLIFCVIAAIGLYQSQRPAKVEFKVIQAGWDGLPPDYENNGSVAIIYGVSIQFKAVGGDAHNVIVSWVGLAEESEPVEIGTMKEGVAYVTPSGSLVSSMGYKTTREESGYPVKIRIYSEETGWVKLTVYII